jgi:uncharacterized protein YggE
MKKLVIAFALLAATAGYLTASTPEPTPGISVSGTGRVKYVPDMGYVHVGVSSEGTTAAEAWQKNEAAVRKMFEALKELGIQDKDFKTTNLNVQPRYLHKKDEAPRLIGYVASYDLTVTVRRLPQMPILLDRLVAAGANRNMSVSFSHSQLDEMLDRARAGAVADARKKANLYVTGAGARLGAVLAISDNPYAHHLRPFPVDARLVREGKMGLPIAAGEQDLTVTVTIRWAIDNNRFRLERVPCQG